MALLYLPRLCLTLGIIRLTYLDRTHVAAFGFALFLTCSLMVRNFGDIWQALGWIGLYGGFLIAPRKTYGWPFRLGVILLIFHLLAIPGNLIWGDRVWHSTAAVVIWMAPAILLLIGGVKETFVYLIPAWLLHAGLILYQGVTNWSWYGGVLVRGDMSAGLSHNVNLAAGFLSLGIVYLMTTRYKWLVLVLLPALLFTGSRWGVVVTGIILLLMVITRTVSFKPLGAAILLSVAVFLGVGLFTPLGYRVATIDSFSAILRGVNGDIKERLGVPHIPSFLPRGLAQHPGLHNVPLRIAYENGILAALVWLGITGRALWPQRRRRNRGKYRMNDNNHGGTPPHADIGVSAPSPRSGAVWWLLLALVLLSLLDYYTWMGHLGGFWWLLVGLRLKRQGRNPVVALQTEGTGFDTIPKFLARKKAARQRAERERGKA